MNNNLEEQLNSVKEQIEELEFAIKICENHFQYISEKKQAEKDKFITIDYETQLGQDAYRRMAMQDKLRKLMKECMEIQDKICMDND